MQLAKTSHTTYTFSIMVEGEKFHPCDLLVTLWSVRNPRKLHPNNNGVEIWDMSQKRIDALIRAGALVDTIQKKIANPGPKIDQFIAELAMMVRADVDLSRLWDERYAMAYHDLIRLR